MSAPKPVGLADAAQRDIRSILRYTTRQWGAAQSERYRDRIARALTLISQNPALGHRAEDIPTGFRLLSFGSHTIVYFEEPDQIIVARMLHQSMNRADHI